MRTIVFGSVSASHTDAHAAFLPSAVGSAARACAADCAPVAVRSAAKADNLLGMLDNFAAAGAHGVVVCGDIANVENLGSLIRL